MVKLLLDDEFDFQLCNNEGTSFSNTLTTPAFALLLHLAVWASNAWSLLALRPAPGFDEKKCRAADFLGGRIFDEKWAPTTSYIMANQWFNKASIRETNG